MDPILIEYDAGITCVDAMYEYKGHACCYLMVENNRAAFIETGTAHSVPYLLETLKQKNISVDQVDYVIPTHVHLDHAGGAGLLMSKLPNARLIIHPRGAPHMINPEKLVAGTIAVYGKEKFNQLYGEVIPIDKDRVISANDHFEINLANRTLKFLDTPGHARHHFCMYDENSRGVFTGDTFGLAYKEMSKDNADFIIPTTTPVQFEPEAWYASINKILEHKPKNIYLTHFGRVTEVEQLSRELKQGIKEYVEITKQYLNVDDSESKIRSDIEMHLQKKLQEKYSKEEIVKHTQLLQPDLNLNAAGLKIWLSRLEKAA